MTNTIPKQTRRLLSMDNGKTPDQWFYTASDRELDGVVERDLIAIQYLLREAFADDVTTMGRDMDWDGRAVIMWEEGPEEWTYAHRLPQNVQEYAAVRGLHLEAVNHVVLAVYLGD